MKANEAIKAAMKSSGITQMEMAEQLGMGQSSIAMYLKRDSGMKIENLLRMVNACGFDVALVDRRNVYNTYVIGEQDAVDFKSNEAIDHKIRNILEDELRKAVEGK